MHLLRLAIPFGLSSLLLVACSSKTSTSSGGTACEQGSEGCDCYGNNTCDTGLTCLSKTCVDPSDGTGGSSSAEGGSTKGGTSSSKGGSTSKSSSNGGTTSSTSETTSAGGAVSIGGAVSSGGTTSAIGNSGGSSSVGGSTSNGGSTSGGATSSVGGSAGSAGTTVTRFGGYITETRDAAKTAAAWAGYISPTVLPASSTISPTAFSSLYDFPICASGIVTGMSDYSGVASVAWNLNQAATPSGALADTIVPSLDGITVSIANSGGSPLWLAVEGPTATMTSPADRWCAVVGEGTTFIKWTDFNTQCWNGSGSGYNGTSPLKALRFIVPGASLGTDTNYNFCVQSLKETRDPSGATSDCTLTDPVGTSSLASITGTAVTAATRSGRGYVVQNNVWNGNPANQSLSVSGVSFTVATQSNPTVSTSGAPLSFPSVFIGSNYGNTSNTANLPKQVSSIASLPTCWSWSGNNGVHNSVYSVWFSTAAAGDSGAASGGYLQVWFQRTSGLSPTGSAIATATIGGKPWQVGAGTQSGRPIIWYVPIAGSTWSWCFDMNLFIKDAISRGVIPSSWYLSNVFAGFEIWNGGVSLKTDNFCAVVNSK